MFAILYRLYLDIGRICMASIFYLHKHAPGIFAAIIKELADGTTTSSVPVMIKVGLDILERSSQVPLQLVANQICADLNCCIAVLENPKSLSFGIGMFSR